ncbi:uncharacterized protein BO95DRAFT_435185 [Aspergillus brunneoviolaceus CBS 621.78]|uniref:Uncharacterized protein n=1 Tax=Aspergillus brunneoviolaceus CBS 621.78 TaxID=1450534 RepID=A0ACD1FYW0_9EURO|nr:hypothetical protein BO95DRAFT_435185 [Aspergillus brunneoviolaceus CBS 621.78]RAH42165.1 hypothetical protein BO95DRAFT_435185 [Aspergillus brunneoviolaceus CBS 621.78]
MASQAENAQAFSNLFAENISVRNLKLPLRTLPGSLQVKSSGPHLHPLQENLTTIQLQVPSLPSEITARIVPYDNGNANDIPRLIKLLRLLQPWESGCYQSLLTQAGAMLKSVTEMFPLKLPSDIRLCQAGWLAMFLMVDDLLESIPSSESQDCILEAIEMVNEYPRETSMSILCLNPTPIRSKN